MRQKYLLILTLGLFLISNFSTSVKTSENEYGTADAWIKIQGGDWQEPTTDTYTLKIKEPFQIKAIITSKINGNICPKIGGSGVTQAYEVVDGPSDYEKWLYGWDYNPVSAGWNETFIWTVRPNGEWTDGTAGLNLRVGFSPHDDESDDQTYISLGLINAYIEDEIWEGYTPSDDDDDDGNTNTNENNNKSTPGFEALFIVFALCAVLFIYRKR